MEIDKRIHFEIGEISDKEMTWKEAKTYAEEQGMRLPTRLEFLVMIEQDIELPSWCWTCEEDSAVYAWYVDNDGDASINSKFNGYYAVPIRNL